MGGALYLHMHTARWHALVHARYRTPPKLMDVVEEVAEVLSQWPDDKVRFIAACNPAESTGV